MRSDETPPLLAEYRRKLEEECIPLVERFTVPLYGLQNGQVVHDRTGVLYEIAGVSFVLTAAHDLQEIIGQQIPLFIPPFVDDADPLPLTDAAFFATEAEGGRDVAAIQLSDRAAEALRPAKEFFRHDKIAIADDGLGLYLFFGYPMAWTGKGPSGAITSHPLVYATRQHQGGKPAHASFDPRVHISLLFDQRAIDMTTDASCDLPGIKGVSGCGIWRIADWDATSLDRGPLKNLRLVALQHLWMRYGEQPYVQGTWIKFAVDLVAYYRPDLRKAMRLLDPR
jgi:hypothetical protein